MVLLYLQYVVKNKLSKTRLLQPKNSTTLAGV